MVDTVFVYMDAFVGYYDVLTEKNATSRRNRGLFGSVWTARIFIRNSLCSRTGNFVWI